MPHSETWLPCACRLDLPAQRGVWEAAPAGIKGGSGKVERPQTTLRRGRGVGRGSWGPSPTRGQQGKLQLGAPERHLYQKETLCSDAGRRVAARVYRSISSEVLVRGLLLTRGSGPPPQNHRTHKAKDTMQTDSLKHAWILYGYKDNMLVLCYCMMMLYSHIQYILRLCY